VGISNQVMVEVTVASRVGMELLLAV
jgi:hypothetical protein